MAYKPKTWTQKLGEARARYAEPQKWTCDKTGRLMSIPTIAEIEELVCNVPPGRLVTVGQLSDRLSRKHDVDLCCPLTTGIFAWLVAHGSEESGSPLPWWRVLKSRGDLNPKYPGCGVLQRERLEAEGHRVVARGKRTVVEGYAAALVQLD